jgi:hypothetical protein
MDTTGKPDTLTMKSGEVWDVALQVLSADAKSLEAWMSVAVDVGGKLKVRRYSWKPVSL